MPIIIFLIFVYTVIRQGLLLYDLYIPPRTHVRERTDGHTHCLTERDVFKVVKAYYRLKYHISSCFPPIFFFLFYFVLNMPSDEIRLYPKFKLKSVRKKTDIKNEINGENLIM